MSVALLDIQNLEKSFGQTSVLRGISLSVKEGEVIGLIGASGSGKSTLLRCLNRLETPSAGTVTFQGAQARIKTRTRSASRSGWSFSASISFRISQRCKMSPSRPRSPQARQSHSRESSAGLAGTSAPERACRQAPRAALGGAAAAGRNRSGAGHAARRPTL